MPLYEYGCPACGKTIDIHHGFDEKPKLACEACGAPLQRRFSAAPIVFKGSGFYVTDSRASSKTEKSETTETKSDAKTEAKPETKTESKPETSSAPSAPKPAESKKTTESAA